MNLFEWSDDYLVNLPDFDAEHENLFRIGRQLCGAIAAGAANPQLKQIFTDLADAGASHFAHEERLMKAAGYALQAWHKNSHDTVRNRLADCQLRTDAGDHHAYVEFLQFLEHWLKDHASIADRMLASYLRNRARLRAA